MLETPQDQYTWVGQINTRFWASGDTGTVVILVHGLGGGVENWRDNFNALAEQHRVYALDLVGMGRTDKPRATYSLSYLADFVREFMELQQIDQASLVGLSLGGGVVLKFASLFPQRVAKLVLVDSIGLGKETHFLFRLLTLPLLGDVLGRPSRESTARFLKAMFYDQTLVTDELNSSTY